MATFASTFTTRGSLVDFGAPEAELKQLGHPRPAIDSMHVTSAWSQNPAYRTQPWPTRSRT